jgi:hypothetical protein
MLVCGLVNVALADESSALRPQKGNETVVAPPALKMSWFGVIVRSKTAVAGKQTIEYIYDEGDDYFLATEVWRRDGKVFKKVFTRLTLQDKILVRERQTVVTFDSPGRPQMSTAICGHYLAAPQSGFYRFALVPSSTTTCLHLLGEKVGPDPKNPGAACDLDDSQKVSDEQLEKFAAEIWKGYETGEAWRKFYYTHYGPGTWKRFTNYYLYNFEALRAYRSAEWSDDNCCEGATGGWNWPKGKVSAAKYAHGLNQDYPPGLEKRSKDDYLHRGAATVEFLNTWHRFVRAAAVNVNGAPLADQPRIVEFYNRDGTGVIMFTVIQTMDYAAKPRPKIKSYKIERRFVDYVADDGTWKQRRPAEPEFCQPVKVDIEDVQSDDPALAGEWIRNVVLKDTPAKKPAGGSDQAPIH